MTSIETANADVSIELMYSGAQAMYETEGRIGSTDFIPAGKEVMVVGDLHGHRDNFEHVVGVASLNEHPDRHLVLQEIIHGGPMSPDENDLSFLLLEDVVRLKRKYRDRVHVILGNHEQSELTGRLVGKGSRLWNMIFRLGIEEVFRDRADEVYEAYKVYFRSMLLSVQREDGLCACHTLVPADQIDGFDVELLTRQWKEEDCEKGEGAYEICWGRDYDRDTAKRFAEKIGVKFFITGHEPSDTGFAIPNPQQIIIDCCKRPAAYIIVPPGKPLNIAFLQAGLQVIPADETDEPTPTESDDVPESDAFDGDDDFDDEELDSGTFDAMDAALDGLADDEESNLLADGDEQVPEADTDVDITA